MAYVGGGPVYRVPEGEPGAGNLLLVYHAGRSANPFWSWLGLAKSEDDGATWQDLGLFISPSHPYNAQGAIDIGDSSLVVTPGTESSRKYFYVYFGSDTTFLSVARAPYEELLRAVFEDDTGSPTIASAFSKDAPINLIAEHLDQVAPITLRHRDLIFALEPGFIGTWGEWHDSTSGNENAAAQKVVLDKERYYFDSRFPILVRDDGQLVQYTGNLSPQPDFGLDDDYYASNSTDASTWSPCATRSWFCLRQYTKAEFEAYGAAVAGQTMFVGEFGALYPALQSCAALVS